MSFHDLTGCRHSVDVTAASVFEAAGLAVEAFRRAPFIDPNPGPATRLDVEVRGPSVTHSVTVLQVQKWAESGSTEPRDGICKRRIAEALNRR